VETGAFSLVLVSTKHNGGSLVDTIPTQIMVDFCLSGTSVDLNDLFSQIGINSAIVQNKECVKIKKYAKDTWCLSTEYQKETSVSIPFEKLISSLCSKEKIIKNLITKYNLESTFIIVVRAEDDNRPEMILTQKCVNFASRLNAEIHFDLYFF